jgi:hypothetical protein
MQDQSSQPLAVHVIGVKIPFLELIVLLVKIALAMIPAVFILTVVWALVWRLLGGVLGYHAQTTSL